MNKNIDNNLVFICCLNSDKNIDAYKQYIQDEGYYPIISDEYAIIANCGQLWVFGDIEDQRMHDMTEYAYFYGVEVEYIRSWECCV